MAQLFWKTGSLRDLIHGEEVSRGLEEGGAGGRWKDGGGGGIMRGEGGYWLCEVEEVS